MSAPGSISDPAPTAAGHGSVLRNVAMVSIAGYLEAGIGLFVGVVIARSLGPYDFGHYAFAVWLCGWLIMASNNALTTSSIKFLAEARGSGRLDVAAALAQRLRRLQIASSSTVLGLFGMVVLFWQPAEWHEGIEYTLPLAVIAVWARSGFWAMGAIGKGYERFEPENIALAITALLNLALILALWILGGTMVQFFAVYALTGLCSNLLVRIGLRRCGVRPAAGPIPAETSRRFVRHVALTAGVIVLGLMSQRTVEMLLLKAYASTAVVGYFAIASTLTKGAVDLLAGGMAAVLLPAMSRAFGSGGRDSLSTMLAEATRLYWVIGLAIAGGGITVAEGAIHLLYGNRFEAAIPALMWNLVLAGMLVTHGAVAAVLTAGDRQADRIGVGLVTVMVNIGAGFALIPKFGLNGAIGSLAITQCTGFVFAWWFARRRIQTRLPLNLMARSLAAATVAAAVGTAISELVHLKLAFVVGAAAFLATYLVLLVLFRAARRSDYELVAGLLRRLGSHGRRGAELIDHLNKRHASADATHAASTAHSGN